jgi:hypothetical protein
MGAILRNTDSPTWEFFDRDEVARRNREHLRGGADLHVGLWRVLVFERWASLNQKSGG